MNLSNHFPRRFLSKMKVMVGAVCLPVVALAIGLPEESSPDSTSLIYPSIFTNEAVAGVSQDKIPSPLELSLDSLSISIPADSVIAFPDSTHELIAEELIIAISLDSLQMKSQSLMPVVKSRTSRPVEDICDHLLPFVLGPIYDQANIGHRQMLALDGLEYRNWKLLIDGVDVSSRINGMSDLNWISAGVMNLRQTDLWSRSGTQSAAGALEFAGLRSDSDSVITRVKWNDGFRGFITTDVDFRRPLIGGQFTAATRQIFTHERTPGALFKGNTFYWNWDKDLGVRWKLHIDQHVIRDKSHILTTTDDQRRTLSNMLRFRLKQQNSSLPFLFEFDYWNLDRIERWSRANTIEDHELIHNLGFNLSGLAYNWAYRFIGRTELQDLSSASWGRELWKQDASLDLFRKFSGNRWLELKSSLSKRQDFRRPVWNIGAEFGFSGREFKGLSSSWVFVLDAGEHLPWPDQLYIIRDPNDLDQVVNPWLRDEAEQIWPDYNLSRSSWQRLELRSSLEHEFLGSAVIRAWVVDLENELFPFAGTVSDTVWSWQGYSHTQFGQQLQYRKNILDKLTFNFNEAWFKDNRNYVSYEFPTLIIDSSLDWGHQFFKGELNFSSSIGLRHESGGVNANDYLLWNGLEYWFYMEARRRNFTITWSVRGPAGNDLYRVGEQMLKGHEEWLGIKWNFIN
jgi:hypothetical protein